MATKKLTARFVETVRTDQEREDIADADVRGLQLRVTAQGTKSWAVRYTRNTDGRRRRLTFGTFPGMSLEEARRRAHEELAAIGRGADPAAGVQERKAAPSFRDVVAEWQSAHAEANRSERVRKDDQSMLDRYILPAIGGVKATDIGRRELSKMLNDAKAATDGRQGRKKKGRQGRRLTHRPNRVFELVRAIMRWAMEQGILRADPTLGMKRPLRKEAPRERELSPAEIAVFWKGLDALAITPGLSIAMKLALVTAQRIGEVTGIAKSELVLDGPAPVWVLPHQRSKNNEGNRTPLSPLALRLVREAWVLSGESSWLFPSPKGDRPIDGHAAAVAIFRGRDSLGLPDFRTHDLRRTAATRMGEMGVNPHTISLILNHVSASKSTITNKVYLKYQFDREKREALTAWGARLEEIVSGLDGTNVVVLTTPWPARSGLGASP
jgi:integrase